MTDYEMPRDRKPEPEDVDRFYERQHRQILARIAGDAAVAGDRTSRPSTLRPVLLAAAAILGFAFLGIAMQPVTMLPQATQADTLEPIVSLPGSLPLPTYASWSTDEMLDRNDGSEMGGTDWLLDNETLLAGSEALPAFLQPFGSWPRLPEPAEEGETI